MQSTRGGNLAPLPKTSDPAKKFKKYFIYKTLLLINLKKNVELSQQKMRSFIF